MDPTAPNPPPANPQPTPAPQVIINAAQNTNPTPPAKSKKPLKLIFIIIGIILTLSIILGGIGTAIAYEKININNPTLERSISQIIMNLPLTPKTPRFLLESAALAHNEVSKHSFNISLAAKSQDLASSLGLSQLDAEAKGSVDYSDPKNLKATLNGSITKDLNFDVRKKDSFVYIKINKIPPFITAAFELNQEKIDQLIQNWIGYDSKPLDTEARRTLDTENPEKSLTNEYIVNLTSDLLDENLLPSIQVENEELEQHPTYKLRLSTDEQTINKLIYKIENRLSGNTSNELILDETTVKPSEYIKDLKIDLWIDENDYYVRKIAVSLKINPNFNGTSLPTGVLGISTPGEYLNVLGVESSLYSLGQSETAISAVTIFDNFGQDFTVETPSQYLSPEDFFKQAMEASSYYGDPASPESNSFELIRSDRDYARLTDIASLQQVINVTLQESPNAGNPALLCNLKSTTCSGNSQTGTRLSDGTGWIPMLFNSPTISLPQLPVDPINNTMIHYSFCASNGSWEINAILESSQHIPKMATDGGDDDTKYEVGSNLNLIDKIADCKY